jgi:cytoskeletal protein CcmA (bactofilin family)
MVFRRDSKIDAFQRQISALRHQLGGEQDDLAVEAGEIYDRRLDRFEGRMGNILPILDHGSLEPMVASVNQRERDVTNQDRTAPPLPAVDMETTVIAHSTRWSGDFTSTGSLHVYGQVQGTLEAGDSIFVAAEADVEATITAATVTVAGNVRGMIQCTDRFEILPHGRVFGDVRAPSLVVHDGALMSGQMSMSQPVETRTTHVAGMRGARGGD